LFRLAVKQHLIFKRADGTLNDRLVLDAERRWACFGTGGRSIMKRTVLVASAAFLAACSPQETAAPPAPEVPASLQEQGRAMSAEEQVVFAVGQLAAHLQAQGQSCTVRGAEPRGTVPADVAPDSIYGPYAGADAFTVQCGERLTTVAPDPRQRWLVLLAPGADAPQVVNCADANGFDRCAQRAIPTATPASP
jgi:hypothetical protein